VALQKMGVPQLLAERVLAYQSYVATVHREDLEQPAFRGLSDNLIKELRLCAYRNLVLQAPFLREQSKEVISLIVGALHDTVYLPADFIVRAGEWGREFFFIRRGQAAVFTGGAVPVWGRSEEVVSYNAGDYFGELAMLTGRPRAAWIMAKTYCVCSVLRYSAVEALSRDYPGAFTTLVQSMVRGYQLTSSTNWSDVCERMVDKFGFECVDEAFAWFCEHSETPDDEELSAKAFDEGMRKLKVPELDRKIFWAEIDADNSGAVSLEEFSNKISIEPRLPPCAEDRPSIPEHLQQRRNTSLREQSQSQRRQLVRALTLPNQRRSVTAADIQPQRKSLTNAALDMAGAFAARGTPPGVPQGLPGLEQRLSLSGAQGQTLGAAISAATPPTDDASPEPASPSLLAPTLFCAEHLPPPTPNPTINSFSHAQLAQAVVPVEHFEDVLVDIRKDLDENQRATARLEKEVHDLKSTVEQNCRLLTELHHHFIKCQ
jgi:CRP-like cAMP-binding protein